jgi:hypothetical protein
MRRASLISDIVTRPIGALLATLPFVGAAIILAIAFWPTAEGRPFIALLFPAMLGFLDSLPPDIRVLLFAVACAGLGGSISSVAFISDYDLPSSWRIAAICLIQTTFGMASGIVTFILLRAILALMTRGTDAIALDPYFLSFVAFVTGVFSDRVLALFRSIGVQVFEIKVSREPVGQSGDGEIGNTLTLGDAYALSDRPSVLEKLADIEDRIAGLQSRPLLDNFDGVAVVQLSDRRGELLQEHKSSDNKLSAEAKGGQPCQLRLRLGTADSVNEKGLRQIVKIQNGNKTEAVTFNIIIDSDHVTPTPSSDRVTFSPSAYSRLMAFDFCAPDDPGSYDIFCEISQRGRTIAVLACNLIVEPRP